MHMHTHTFACINIFLHIHTQLSEQNISNDFVIRDLMAECQGVSAKVYCTYTHTCMYMYMYMHAHNMYKCALYVLNDILTA